MNWDEIDEIFWRPLFMIGQSPVSIGTVIQFLLVLILVLLVARFIRRFLQTKLLIHTKMTAGLQYAIARMAGYVALVMGFVIGLSTLGINLTSLAVVAGSLGVGIGFGLQNIVNNFVSGLVILAERPIQIGDRIEVGNVAGRVTRIGSRSSSILTNDNIMIIVPNSEFITGRITNWTHYDQRVRFKVPVSAGFEHDPELIQKLLLEVASSNSHVLQDPPPQAVLLGFGENALLFELRVWSVEMSHRPGALKSALNFAIWKKFRDHSICMPYPQRDLRLREPVSVQLKPA